MSRTLDFNAIEQPTLEIIMKDKDHTVLHVSAPNVDLVERMQALEPTIKKMAEGGDARENFKKLYDFFAEVMSHNEECIRVTAEELRDVYKLNLVELFKFYWAYDAFVDDIKNAKN